MRSRHNLTRRAIVVCAAAAWGSGCRPEQSKVDPHDAVQAAHEFIKTRLVTAGSAVFGGDADTLVEELSPGKFRVNGMVDYTSNGGSTMRVTFMCVVSRDTASKRWSLDEMDLR